MSKILITPFLSILLMCLFSTNSKAQDRTNPENTNRNVIIVGAKKTVAVTGKVAFVVVKETANLGWETTKFTTKEVVAPVAKTILLKALPKIIKRATPIATKAALQYLKL
ncbi:MAG TPA: hypothetical protein PKY82_29770 [Pyrinomonadaceae bacterium]|nr:hypothetical protein [Pyrinomonadaceae bacterium]